MRSTVGEGLGWDEERAGGIEGSGSLVKRQEEMSDWVKGWEEKENRMMLHIILWCTLTQCCTHTRTQGMKLSFICALCPHSYVSHSRLNCRVYLLLTLHWFFKMWFGTYLFHEFSSLILKLIIAHLLHPFSLSPHFDATILNEICLCMFFSTLSSCGQNTKHFLNYDRFLFSSSSF